MSSVKAQISEAAKFTIGVLNAGVKSESSPDWLVLDFEKAQQSYRMLEESLELLKTLPKKHSEFSERACNILTYCEATVSVLNDNTAEAHAGRSGSAVSQLNKLLKIMDEAFPEAAE